MDLYVGMLNFNQAAVHGGQYTIFSFIRSGDVGIDLECD